MADAVAGTPVLALAAVRERYYRYSRTIRSRCAEYVRSQFTYLDRLFAFLGPPETAVELFTRLDSATITAFLLDYAPRHGPGSRRNMYTVFRMFLRFAYEEQFLPQDLSALVPLVRRRAAAHLPKALPESCIVDLEENVNRRTPEGRRDAAIVCLLSTYGVRGAQLRRLCLEDIDWKNALIRFPTCKGGSVIEQHLTAKAGNRLADYIVRGRPSSACREVFLEASTATALAHPRDLSRIIHRRLLEVGASVPTGVSRGTHGFRHAFATRMVGRIPFKDVADMLGHRSPSSTLRYGRVDVRTLQQAALPWPGGAE